MNDAWLEVRRATLSDVPFIRALALQSVIYGIPEGRDIPNEVVVARAAESLKDLELLVHRRRQAAVLVAFDRVKGVAVGYLILEFKRLEETTGEMQSHVFDLAVAPEYMGRFVPHALVGEAARVSHQQGYRYMSAMISASNQRALLTAIKMGFDVERYGLIMACGPDGIEQMPGRRPDERGHAVDRARRQRRRKNKQELIS